MNAPAWALGHELNELSSWTACFAQHDKAYTQGAFTRVKENAVAAWLQKGQLLGAFKDDHCIAAVVHRRVKQWRKLCDFTGITRLELGPHSAFIERIAWVPGFEVQIEALLHFEALGDGPAVLQLWQEHQPSRELAERLGFSWACSKIRASSEIVGVWTRDCGSPRLQGREELVSIKRLSSALREPAERLAAAADALGLDYAQHYSSYNKRRSWTSLALRGFSDDSAFIEKPAEMSKGWKAKHPELLAAQPRNTELWSRLATYVQPLLDAVPVTSFERVRLMRLAPGGELTRHADITDKDLGLSDRKIARLHVPLETNAGVLFSSWTAAGERLTKHMAAGELWYLDIRKPHAAINAGQEIRTHLVLDCVCNSPLRQLIMS